jgi:hypothetical protein
VIVCPVGSVRLMSADTALLDQGPRPLQTVAIDRHLAAPDTLGDLRQIRRRLAVAVGLDQADLWVCGDVVNAGGLGNFAVHPAPIRVIMMSPTPTMVVNGRV